MCCLGIFKRVVPFLLAFTVGLFIASFFVTIGAPNFGNSRRQAKMREMRQVKMEVEELRREKCRLKQEIEELRRERSVTITTTESLGDVDVFAVPPPPLAPTVHGKTRTVTIK